MTAPQDLRADGELRSQIKASQEFAKNVRQDLDEAWPAVKGADIFEISDTWDNAKAFVGQVEDTLHAALTRLDHLEATASQLEQERERWLEQVEQQRQRAERAERAFRLARDCGVREADYDPDMKSASSAAGGE